MKTIDEIEMMGLEDLESFAADAEIEVPEELEGQLGELISTSGMIEDSAKFARGRRAFVKVLAAAACLQILVLGGIAVSNRLGAPADTFDSPELAYASLERSLMKMSACLDKSRAALEKGNEIAAMPGNKMDEILNKQFQKDRQ